MFQSRLFSGTSARSGRICGGNGYSLDEHAVVRVRRHAATDQLRPRGSPERELRVLCEVPALCSIFFTGGRRGRGEI